MRPLLLGRGALEDGETEPFSPYVRGTTGERLWRLLADRTGATREEYCAAFERHYMRSSVDLPAKGDSQRKILAIGATALYWLKENDPGSVRWKVIFIPRPTGLDHWYDDRDNRDSVSRLLAELYLSVSLKETML